MSNDGANNLFGSLRQRLSNSEAGSRRNNRVLQSASNKSVLADVGHDVD